MQRKNNKKKKILKRYVCQLGVPPKSRKHTPFLCILIQTIYGSCIFSNWLAKLANMVHDKKVDIHTPPPQPWGPCSVFTKNGYSNKILFTCQALIIDPCDNFKEQIISETVLGAFFSSPDVRDYINTNIYIYIYTHTVFFLINCPAQIIN